MISYRFIFWRSVKTSLMNNRNRVTNFETGYSWTISTTYTIGCISTNIVGWPFFQIFQNTIEFSSSATNYHNAVRQRRFCIRCAPTKPSCCNRCTSVQGDISSCFCRISRHCTSRNNCIGYRRKFQSDRISEASYVKGITS